MTTITSYHRIFMGEAAIHFPSDPNTILATNGLISCIGFGGWEPHKKMGFLVHFGGPKQVADFYSKGIELLSTDLQEGDSLQFDCTITGGWQKTSASLQIFDAIQRDLQSHKNIRFRVTQISPMSATAQTKSLSLDSATGQFSTYDIENDPQPRYKTSQEEARDLGFSSVEELVYRNKLKKIGFYVS